MKTIRNGEVGQDGRSCLEPSHIQMLRLQADCIKARDQARILALHVTDIVARVIAMREGRCDGEGLVKFAELLRDSKRLADAVIYGE